MNYITKNALLLLSVITLGVYSCGNTRSLTDFRQVTSSNAPRFMADVTLANTNSSNITLATTPKTRQHNSNTANVSDAMSYFLEKYASVMGILPQMLRNSSLYAFIDEWYGVRYRLGGTDKSGIDCSAFVQKMYEQVFGVNLVRTAFQQFSQCSRVAKGTEELKEGDLVFFKTRGRNISHVGVYLINDYFVHSSSSLGVVISNLNEVYWKKHYAGSGQVASNEVEGSSDKSKL